MRSMSRNHQVWLAICSAYQTCDLPGQIWSRVNGRLDRNQGGQVMPKKRYTPEENIQHLRTVELDTGKGLAVLDSCRKLGITEQTYYRWKKEYGRYGYRTVTDLVRREGWEVGRDRVYTIRREEGLQVPAKQPKRARLWRADGSCLRLRPVYRHHVWSYDFVADRTHDGRPLRILNILDEYTRECLTSVVARRIPLARRAVDPG